MQSNTGELSCMEQDLACPLCTSESTTLYHKGRRRRYWICSRCSLVFVSPAVHLDGAAEKAIYDLHENDPADRGYRRFLSRLANPLLARLTAGAKGVDFGCGPGPALAHMLDEAGMDVTFYDPFYAPDRSVWQRRYDFITATEVVEHLYHPSKEWASLFSVLKPGGWLGVMTKRVRDQAAFARWHYITDPTHVCFYSKATFGWIAGKWAAEVGFPANDVVLLRKG